MGVLEEDSPPDWVQPVLNRPTGNVRVRILMPIELIALVVLGVLLFVFFCSIINL